MYLRATHAETSLPPLLSFIAAHPLGLLTTAVPSPNHPLIQHTFLPWVLDPPTNLSTLIASNQHLAPPMANQKVPVKGLEGCQLRGHMARGNPHAKALIEAANAAGGGGEGNALLDQEVTVVFSSGEAQHYITPKWYRATKPETGKVVPTWDYVAVEVRGRVRVWGGKDGEAGGYLQRQVEDLTGESERSLGFRSKKEVGGGREAEKAWEVGDAPAPYIEIMKKAIVGVEVEVESVVGKWKMSQELKEGDRDGVVEGLRERKEERGQRIAELVEMRRPPV